jgi:hypothetical protein
LITADSCKTGEEIQTKELDDEVSAAVDKEGAVRVTKNREKERNREREVVRQEQRMD